MRCSWSVARPTAAPQGFLHFAVVRARPRAVALVDAASPGDAERVQRVARLRDRRVGTREHGLRARLAELRAVRRVARPEAELYRLQKVQRRALLALKGRFQLDNLLALQPQVLPELGAAVRRLRAPAAICLGSGLLRLRPSRTCRSAGRHRRDGHRGSGLPWRSHRRWRSTGVLGAARAASALPPLSLRGRCARCGCSSRTARWLAGSIVGIGGWVLYVAALGLAPLSLVQAVSAGGVGVLALLAWRVDGCTAAPA